MPNKFWLDVWKERGRWEVSVGIIEEDYYFVDGWVEFRQDNQLNDGDFLTFCLVKEREFLVTIFAPNGCLKFLKEMIEEHEGAEEYELEEEKAEEHNYQTGSSTSANVIRTAKSWRMKIMPSHGKKNNKVVSAYIYIYTYKYYFRISVI